MQEKSLPLVQPISETFIPSLVKVHREAFAGYMNTKLGDGYIKAFFRWFRDAEKSIALMVTDSEQKALGYVVGAPFKWWDIQASRDLFLPAAFGVATHPWVVFNSRIRKTALARVATIFSGKSEVHIKEPELPQPTMALVGIGVSKEAKGTDCAARLMEEFEEKSRQLEMRSMILDVYANNERARRFYEKCGWQPFIEPVNKELTMYYSKNI